MLQKPPTRQNLIFFSRMSHEIRTPMNVIIGMLQIARGNVDDPEKMRVNLAKIGTASDHLLGLINDVLDLSKIENGKMTLASDPFRLADLLDHVEEVIRPQCEQRSQELTVRGPACADAVYVGDTVRLKQLLINLLSNSVKYTPEGGHVKLETNAAAAPVMGYRQVVFVVSDDGIGMSEEFVERMFEPFVMEGRSHEQGTGLGMSIVKNVVTMMGGSIEVDSTIGKGTTFTVTLSLRIAFEAELKSFEDDARDRGSNGPSTRSDAPRRRGVAFPCDAFRPSRHRAQRVRRAARADCRRQRSECGNRLRAFWRQRVFPSNAHGTARRHVPCSKRLTWGITTWCSWMCRCPR